MGMILCSGIAGLALAYNGVMAAISGQFAAGAATIVGGVLCLAGASLLFRHREDLVVG